MDGHLVDKVIECVPLNLAPLRFNQERVSWHHGITAVNQGFEHLHLRGFRESIPHNPSLLHQVALLLQHAFLPF